MTPTRVHILYEYGADLRPHNSSYIRLIRPLTHPNLADRLAVTFSPRLPEQPVDVIILDRLWRPDISPSLARQLVSAIRALGAHLIYALDDNLLDLPLERHDWPQERHLEAMHVFLDHADAVWVTTDALAQRLSQFNSRISVLYNHLDERLIIGGSRRPDPDLFGANRKVIGYMGTATHERDFQIVLPALETISQRYPKEVEIQIVGVISDPYAFRALKGVPIRHINPEPEEQEYPLFQFWFSSQSAWDIAISPLHETPFNRCKSDIKFLDYSAVGVPGIYSRVTAYSSTIQHGKTGWIVENEVDAWVEALEVLLSDDARRLQIAEQSAKYLYMQRILARHTDAWLEAIELVVT